MRRLLVLPILASLLCVGADWPQFRGPGGQGHSDAKKLPLHWSERDNVAWKVPIPGTAWSSPVNAGGLIWMAPPVEIGRSLRAICVHRDSGEILHNVEAFRRERPGPVHGKNSFATPTPVLDDGRVYVHFGEYGTACLSSSGQAIWKTTALRFQQPYAAASSPILFGDLLILTCDGTDRQFMAALDKRTGDIVWKKPRGHLKATPAKTKTGSQPQLGYPKMSYATPLVIELNGSRNWSHRLPITSLPTTRKRARRSGGPATRVSPWWLGRCMVRAWCSWQERRTKGTATCSTRFVRTAAAK